MRSKHSSAAASQDACVTRTPMLPAKRLFAFVAAGRAREAAELPLLARTGCSVRTRRRRQSAPCAPASSVLHTTSASSRSGRPPSGHRELQRKTTASSNVARASAPLACFWFAATRHYPAPHCSLTADVHCPAHTST